MTLTGTLRFRDIGPGAWILETSDGTVHDLVVGEIPSADLRRLRDQVVHLDGTRGGFGFGMMGASSLTIRTLRPAG